jgi:lysophospholipase L1-like esterase
VVNSGISGNRILDSSTGIGGQNAFARLARDMLTPTGASTVILLEGINDIGNLPHPDPAVLTQSLTQLATQARAQGLKVIGATITPFQGWRSYNEERESARQKVNDFIRTSPAFDEIIDFDATLRDPSNPNQLNPRYDSGDHLHPSDAGYEAMANAVNLRMLH